MFLLIPLVEINNEKFLWRNAVHMTNAAEQGNHSAVLSLRFAGQIDQSAS